MDDNNINTSISSSGDVQFVSGSGDVESTSTTSSSTGISGQSTISQSEVAEELMLNMAIPILQQPSITVVSYQDMQKLAIQGVDGTTLAVISKETEQDDISAMLDAWLKNIRETNEMKIKADEQRRLEGLDPVSRAKIDREQPEGMKLQVKDAVDFNVYLHSLPPQDKVNEINFYAADIGNIYKDVTINQSLPATSLVSMGIVIGTTGIIEKALIDPNIAGVNPIQDVWNTLPQQFIQGDMRAELSILGALMVTGAKYDAAGVAEAKGLKTGQEPSPKDRAESYAQSVVKLIGADDFNATLMAIVTRNIDRNNPLADQTASMVKIRLLVSALLALYHAETQGGIEVELGAMLKGDMKFGDMRDTLIALINSQLANLTPSQKEREINTILDFAATNPDVKELTEGKIFGFSGDFEASAELPVKG